MQLLVMSSCPPVNKLDPFPQTGFVTGGMMNGGQWEG